LLLLERNLCEAVPHRLAHLSVPEELSMNKSILVGVAILTLSTSAALAAQRTHHGRAMHPNAPVAATNPANAYAFGGPGVSPVGLWGSGNSNDRSTYMKNLHDSGYNPKNNFNSNGTIKTQ
jgi:hypothetical protein